MMVPVVDINQQDEQGNTALHHACINGQVEAIQALLERGADCSIINTEGSYPISVMLDKQHPIVLELLARETDYTIQWNHASELLYAAILAGNAAFAEKLCVFPVSDLITCARGSTLFLVLKTMQAERDRSYSVSSENRAVVMQSYEKVAIALIQRLPFLTEEQVVGTKNGPQGERSVRSSALTLLLSDALFDNCVQALVDTNPKDNLMVLNPLLIWAAQRSRNDVIARFCPDSGEALLTPAAVPVVPGFERAQQKPEHAEIVQDFKNSFAATMQLE